MKNLNTESLPFNKVHIKLVLAIILLVGGSFGFYTFILSPLTLEKASLKASIETLDTQVQDVSALGKQLDEARQSVIEKEDEVKTMKESDNYKSISYIDFVDSVGVLQQKTGVEILSVVEETHIAKESYWEIPVNLVIAGGYDQIISFINGIYASDRFHVVTDVKMHNDSSVLTSDKNLILSSDWASQIKSVIDRKYPGAPPIVETPTEESGETTETPTVEPPSNGVVEQEDEVLHLDFSFKFISIEDPSIVK